MCLALEKRNLTLCVRQFLKCLCTTILARKTPLSYNDDNKNSAIKEHTCVNEVNVLLGERKTLVEI